MMTDEQVEKRALLVAYSIALMAEEILKGLVKQSEEVRDASQETKESLKILLTYTNLFHAEQFFSEQIDQDEFRRLKEKLESHFDVNNPDFSKFLSWIRTTDNSLKYFGLEAAKIVGGKADALIAMDLTIIYSSYADGFFTSLRRAWSLISDFPNL